MKKKMPLGNMPRYTAALLPNVSDFSASDFAVGKVRYAKILAHVGHRMRIDCESVEGYFDVTFEDGFTIQALSSIHIKSTASW